MTGKDVQFASSLRVTCYLLNLLFICIAFLTDTAILNCLKVVLEHFYSFFCHRKLWMTRAPRAQWWYIHSNLRILNILFNCAADCFFMFLYYDCNISALLYNSWLFKQCIYSSVIVTPLSLESYQHLLLLFKMESLLWFVFG